MSSFVRLVIDSDGSANDFKSECNLAMGGLDAANSFANYIAGLTGGNNIGADLSFKVGSTQAFSTFTFASTGPTDGQTATVCGVTVTAVTADPEANQFVRSNTPSVNATNMAAAINASSSFAGIVTASANLGVCTITAVVPGKIGNGLVAANVDMSNTTVASFAASAASDGTSYSINMS